jgi:hypothetical protein
MPVAFGDDDPTAWDRLYIGGLVAPGFVRDINVVRGRKVQKNAGPGIDGANLVAQGRNLAAVPITLEIVGRARSEGDGEGDRAPAERADRRSDRPRRVEAAARADVPDADAAERGAAAGAGGDEVSPQWRISLRPLPGARERT